MTLVDPKDHILKVSCHYLYFWLKYSFEEVCPGRVGGGGGRVGGGRVVFYGYKDQPRADQFPPQLSLYICMQGPSSLIRFEEA